MSLPSSSAVDLYAELTAALDELVAISEGQSRRAGSVLPTELIASTVGCERVLARIQELDRRLIGELGGRPVPPEMEVARERARQLTTTALGNFARCHDLLEKYRATMLAQGRTLVDAQRTLSAYRNGTRGDATLDFGRHG